MRPKYTLLTDSQWKSIEKLLTDKRKRKYCLRNIFNAILWICRTGCQWRNLSSEFPYWQIVYYYFNKWNKNRFFEKVMRKFVRKERVRQGRNYAPSAAAIDSQSIKRVHLYILKLALMVENILMVEKDILPLIALAYQ